MSYYYFCGDCGYVYLELSRKRMHQCIRCHSKDITERFVAKKDLSDVEIAIAEMVKQKFESRAAPE